MIRPEHKCQRGSWRAARCLFLLLALALSPTVAFAHAKLIRSQPKANSTSEQAPRLVELWFNEELEPGFNTIEVTDQQGKRLDRGEVTLAEGGKKAQVELQELSAGTYTVVWKALSTDEHTIRGRFTFKVMASAPAAAVSTPAPAETPGTPPQEAQPAATEMSEGSAAMAVSEDSPITWADSAVRWLAYLAMMTLFGGFASRLFVLGPALRAAAGAHTADVEEALGASASRTILLLRAGVVVLFLTLLLALVFQSAAVHGVGLGGALAPSLLSTVITKTGFGSAWIVAVLAAIALAMIVFFLGRSDSARRSGGGVAWWWAGLVASAGLLVAPSLTGHSMASAREYHFAVLSDWLHLVAGGFWVGGLFHLALAMPPALSRLAGVQRARALRRVITLFTRVAVPSVAVVLVAGLYNSWIHVGSFDALWGTPYGKTLLVKLLLILPMLLLGAVNNFYYGKRAARLAEGGEGTDDMGSERGFSRSVKLEAALGVLVLLAAAVLVFITPPRKAPARMTEVRPAAQEGLTGR